MCKDGFGLNFCHSGQDGKSSHRGREKHGGDKPTESSIGKRATGNVITKFAGIRVGHGERGLEWLGVLTSSLRGCEDMADVNINIYAPMLDWFFPGKLIFVLSREACR